MHASATPASDRTVKRRAPLFILSLGLAMVLGALVSLAAFYVARYGPSGGDWSFRGNGAISVYFALPAVAAAGWTAIAAHSSGRRWLLLGLGAGLAGLALALLDAALLPLFGPRADQFGSPLVSVAVLAWAVAAPSFAAIPPQGRNRAPGGAHLAAAGLWAAGMIAGAVIGGVILPPGS